jgi:hypothetical protein
MPSDHQVGRAVIIVVKAILIAAAILWLGGYFGLHVREAGGGVADRNGGSTALTT